MTSKWSMKLSLDMLFSRHTIPHHLTKPLPHPASSISWPKRNLPSPVTKIPLPLPWSTRQWLSLSHYWTEKRPFLVHQPPASHASVANIACSTTYWLTSHHSIKKIHGRTCGWICLLGRKTLKLEGAFVPKLPSWKVMEVVTNWLSQVEKTEKVGGYSLTLSRRSIVMSLRKQPIMLPKHIP